MKPESERVKEILLKALQHEGREERRAFVVAACQDSPELRGEVESLLRASEQAGDFLSQAITLTPPGFELEPPGTMIGRYKLLEKIGEGGFGVVYLAEQQEPVKRKVALKVIKAGMDTREVVARFETERQALALMDHPNIAKVLDGGATESGRPYFVMELVRGIPITDYCDQNNLSTVDRLQLFIKVCQAVQHAHQKAVIHRDLKPSNILVTLHDGEPVPKVIDFGVAKALGQKLTQKTLFTAFRQMIGTPAYMSPEQAEMSGLDIDTRSDIYSLGVLLYELLTGVTPVDKETLAKAALDEIRRMICETEPPKPSTRLQTLGERLVEVAKHRRAEPAALGRLVRGDLDWIVMKCLEKDRLRRYETTNGLAMDLRRHLGNEPVLAAPPSMTYRFQRFARRHLAALATASAFALVLVSAAVISTTQAQRASREAKESALQRSAATNEAARAAAALKESETHRQRAEVAEGEARLLLYAANMNLIQREWEQNNIGRVRELLQQTEDFPEKDFEWLWWQRQIHRERLTLSGHLGGVRSVAFSSDGRRIASANGDGTASIWEASSGRELLTLHNATQAEVVAFSPDGSRIVADCDRQAQVWDADTGQELLTLTGHSDTVVCAMFSRDGQRILTGSLDATAKEWDATSGRELATLGGYTNAGAGVLAAFSPDGLRIVTSCDRQPVKVWDSAGHELFELPGNASESADIDNPYVRVAFSPDGKSIITAGGQTARLWDGASGAEVLSLNGHTAPISAVAFSPDGRWVATASQDQTAKLWETASGRELLTLKGHAAEVWSVAFSPDGQRVATGSLDQTVKIWDTSRGVEPLVEPLTLEGHRDRVGSVAVSPDGKRVVTGSRDQTVKVWDATSGQELLTFRGHTNAVNCVAFSPEGDGIASGSDDRLLKLWDAATGRELLNFSSWGRQNSSLAFSPNGKRIATVDDGEALSVFDTSNGKLLLRLNLHVWGAASVAVSPDGERIVTGSWDGTAAVWNATNGRELVRLKAHEAPVNSVALSPDGKRLITGSFDRTAKVWQTSTAQKLLVLKGHTAEVLCVAISPSGRRIATGSLDDTVRIWDALTGRELLTLKGHTGGIWALAFSSDGRRLISGSADHTARIWEAASPNQVAVWSDADERRRFDPFHTR